MMRSCSGFSQKESRKNAKGSGVEADWFIGPPNLHGTLAHSFCAWPTRLPATP
jgi:hypothetical protein